METDWHWVWENPKEAAAEIDRLRAAMKLVLDNAWEQEYEHGYFVADHAIKALRETV